MNKKLLNKIEKENINYFFSYWGPFLFRTHIDPELTDLIYEEGLNCKKNWNHGLAGQIKKEFLYPKKIKIKLYKYLDIYFKNYFKAQNKHYNANINIEKIKIKYLDMWINFQNKNEYNPVHAHNGTHSFVIYCSIPEKIKEEYEKDKHKTTFSNPGGISFLYGESPVNSFSSNITTQAFFPEKNLMFIFPSFLRHHVFPFKCDATRVSVSGNIIAHDHS